MIILEVWTARSKRRYSDSFSRPATATGPQSSVSISDDTDSGEAGAFPRLLVSASLAVEFVTGGTKIKSILTQLTHSLQQQQRLWQANHACASPFCARRVAKAAATARASAGSSSGSAVAKTKS